MKKKNSLSLFLYELTSNNNNNNQKIKDLISKLFKYSKKWINLFQFMYYIIKLNLAALLSGNDKNV
jgi:hypothetical protein